MSAPYTQSLAAVLDMISALDYQSMMLVEEIDRASQQQAVSAPQMDTLVTLRRKVREFAAIVGGEYYTLGCALLGAAVPSAGAPPGRLCPRCPQDGTQVQMCVHGHCPHVLCYPCRSSRRGKRKS